MRMVAIYTPVTSLASTLTESWPVSSWSCTKIKSHEIEREIIVAGVRAAAARRGDG